MTKFKPLNVVLFAGEAFYISEVLTGPHPRADYRITSIARPRYEQEVLEEDLLPAP